MPKANQGENGMMKENHTFQEYKYRPLLPHHIRLLSFSAGSEELHVIHTNLNTAPNYTSVSYSWNDQQRDHNVHIDSHNLKIIENLRIGLPYLIKKASTQFLWVDEICIDQENEEERAVQVLLMEEIYTRCQECLVWLGDGTPETDIAIDVIPRISECVKLYGAKKAWEGQGINAQSSEILESNLWRGIVNLFSRPWFTRVWTLQECILPDNVLFLCGSKVLAFTDIEPLAWPLLQLLASLQLFFKNADLGESKLFEGFLRFRRITEFKKLRKNPTSCLDTLRLLNFTRNLSASNSLDKIYGILGLAANSLRDHLKINYHSSDVQVSRQVAAWYTSYGEDLFILNLASSFRHCKDELPSWVPNLSRLGSHWCLGVIWPRFRTGMDKQAISRTFSSHFSGELHVRGIRVDQITHVVTYSGKPTTSQAERCRNILKWEEGCLELSKSVSVGASDNVPKAHWTTIISGICDDHLHPTRDNYDALKCLLRLISAGECLTPELEARYQDLTVQIRRLCKVSRHGKFFCTQLGRIGLGPISTQPGDQICIFYNGFTPFIIHQKPELASKYQLVGDSYTYGLMNGEAFQFEIRKPAETFILI